tara:strand:+ start:460 stop:669 length:210 start_codon:yes stop_codon:yes gene_type:complete
MKEMMKHCAEKCRWCPLIPLTLGVIAFLLGYYLDAETVRILWLVFSGLLVLMGAMCFLMINMMARSMSK